MTRQIRLLTKLSLRGLFGPGRLCPAAFAEIGRTAHAGHGVADHLERDDARGAGDPFAEELGDARFDVEQRVGVVLGQTAADVVEVAFQRAAGVVVENEDFGADVYVYDLFHDVRGVCRGPLAVYYFYTANIIVIFVLCNTKYYIFYVFSSG